MTNLLQRCAQVQNKKKRKKTWRKIRYKFTKKNVNRDELFQAIFYYALRESLIAQNKFMKKKKHVENCNTSWTI